MDEIEIKQVNADEYKKVLNYLYEIDDIFPVPMSQRVDSPTHLDKLFSRGVVMVALDKQKICGILLGYINDKELNRAYIATLGVSEGYRSCEIGTGFIDKFYQMAKKQDFDYVALHAHKDNIGAIKLYQRLGFSLTFDDNKPYKESVYLTKAIEK